MSNELKNIKVKLISLVDKAANLRTVIFKSVDAGEKILDCPLHNIIILKTDDEERMVYGIVYAVNDIDSQDDFAKPATVKKAMQDFMKSLNSTAKVDTQHNLEIADGVHIVENWIVRKNDELFPDEKDLGAWAIGVKVENDEIWKAIKDGEYTGFSMYGTAERIPDAEVSKGIIDKVISEVKKYFKMDAKEIKLVKDFNQLMGTQEIQDFVWVLSDSIRQALNDETVEDKKAQILANIDQFRAKIDSITIAKAVIAEHCETTADGIVMKAGKVLSEANLTKLQTAIDNINAILAAAKNETQKSNNNTMDEKIKKQIDDAVADAVAKKDEEYKAKITELQGTADAAKQENETLKKEVEELKKTSPGSGQTVTDPGTVEKSDKISFLGLGQ